MKKYKVSLALKVPSNFEVEVYATTPKGAFKKALERYHNGEFNEDSLSSVDWDNLELDINEKSNLNNISDGINIEETS